MTWTKDNPNVTGWYWTYQVDGKTGRHNTPVIVYIDCSGPIPWQHYTSKPDIESFRFYDRYYYGPLPCPAITHDLPLFAEEE